MTIDLPRRFYTNATVADDGAGIMLDARRLKTARGDAFAAPARTLADAMAAEWAAQGEFIVPSSMPLTQLAFAAIDHTPARRDELVKYIAKFGETDLVCHRAASPPPLVARQSTMWDPIVVWAAHDLGVVLPVVIGVVAAQVPSESRETLAAHAAALDDFQLTALAQATGLAGSVLIAFALLRQRIDAETAFALAALDDLWSQEQWGQDAEAQDRLDSHRAEFENIVRFIALLNA
ncbi:ATP12 family protein [Terricaulis silvestris]|uniref:ATP12 chaperone protein n=1 Tax=Terricaulis silvestris TaxID=2686094 RepID=A0A6I6MQI9_9CAUL|nr:ATP12 family protein [Terricaulis silvestris]QGZ95047.1 ATP12 chaperone protein [Terricaulis silvestris]